MQTANANPLAALHSQLMQLPMAYPAFGLQPQIHPAFLHTPYAASPLTYRPAKAVGKSFTIDAILGRDEDRPVKNARFESAHPYMPSIANMGFRNALNMKEPKNELKKNEWKSKSKRVRTIFTPDQLEKLETEFERQQYMVGTERYYLASSLNLTEAQVKVWFQNRRIKWRKQNLEAQHAKLKELDLLHSEESDQDEDEDDFDDGASSDASDGSAN